jgi:hypothetical protein
LFTTPQLYAQSPKDYQVKAVLLFNVMRYTTWPAKPEADTFNLCVFGNNPFQDNLQLVMEGERVQDKPANLLFPQNLTEISPCQALFLGHSPHYTEREILSEAARYPILTVGDSETFIFNGGMVYFYPQANKIRFAVNPDAVSAQGLKISANLLYLAKIMRHAPIVSEGSEP